MAFDLGLDDEVTAVEDVDSSATGFATALITLMQQAFNAATNPFGSACVRNVGTGSGQIPLLGGGGRLAYQRLPHGTGENEVALLGPQGRFAPARLGANVGTTPGSRALYDDGQFREVSTTGRLVAGTAATKTDLTDGSATATHSLGTTPHSIVAYIQCTSAEHNYAVGDRIYMSNSPGFTVWASATQVGVATDGSAIVIVAKNGTLQRVPTAASWSITATPYTIS